MQFIDGQQLIQIDKDTLIGKLAANRAQHRAVFEEACAGYRTMAIERMEGMLEDARQGRQITVHIGLTMPADHTRDYDRVITALTMSVDSLATLTEQQFAHYVMDDWSWKRDFLTLAGSYSATAGSLYASTYGQ
jgi:hypothetical protein